MLFHKRNPPVGSRPGTLVFPEEAAKPRLRVMSYTGEMLEEKDIARPAELEAILAAHRVTWVDVQGLGDESLIREIGAFFKLHDLALEDAVNVPQRPKSEAYAQHHLYITRMTMMRSATDEVDTEQVSIFLGSNFVLTLQERYGDVFDPVRARVRAGVGPIRRAGPDYLAYALIDTVIDGYYPVLERIGEHLEILEEEAMVSARKSTLREIYQTKRQLLTIRRAVWPQREAVNSLIRDESPLVGPEVRVYLRDCYDHAVQVIDVTETFRELSGNLIDLYLSSVSMRTNDVMKVLTIMASIFIPLTFLAGIYGMNFDNMPELHSRWGYPLLLAVMLMIGGFMVWLFWRRGWIGDRETDG